MQSPPISQAEIDARIDNHIDELLELWSAEQRATKTNDLELIASAIPFTRSETIRVRRSRSHGRPQHAEDRNDRPQQSRQVSPRQKPVATALGEAGDLAWNGW